MKPMRLFGFITTTMMANTAYSTSRPRSKVITLGGYDFSLPQLNDRHKGTIINWPSSTSILSQTWQYKGANISATRQEVANLAKAIAKFEPVEVFVQMPPSSSNSTQFLGSGKKTNRSQRRNRAGLFSRQGSVDHDDDSGYASAIQMLQDIANVTLHVTPNVDSLWARDTGPFFVYATPTKSSASNKTTQPVGMVLNFNQWGQKDVPSVDSYFAATACSALDREAILAPFVAEGGGIEVDGLGTLIATESAILNPNRNPGVDKTTMEDYFGKVFGITKVLWIPGMAGEDITDDHIDGLARFGPDGVVFLSKPFVPAGENEEDYLGDYWDIVDRLDGETNALNKPFTLVDIPEPDPSGLGFPDGDLGTGSVSYVNYYAVNDGIILAKFGDEKADQRALQIMQKYFPERVVEQVMLHQIALQGGGIHCSTQEIY